MAQPHRGHLRHRSLHVRTPPDVQSSSDSSSSASSSAPATGNGNEKTGTNISVPVALGVMCVLDALQDDQLTNRIPIVLAIGIFVFLHRRHVKRLRQEDANDPHKSLDFGWDPASKNEKKRRKGAPRAIVTDLGTTGLDEKTIRGGGRDRGLSMDMDVGSPYVLPPGVTGSRESLRSMGRTINSQPDDRYRPLTTLFAAQDAASLRSASRTPRSAFRPNDDVASLQRQSPDVKPQASGFPAPDLQMPEPAHVPSPPGAYPEETAFARNSYVAGDDQRVEIDDGSCNPTAQSPVQPASSRRSPKEDALPALPVAQSARVSGDQNYYDASSDTGEVRSPQTAHTDLNAPTRGSSQEYMPTVDEYGSDLQTGDYGYDLNRLSMGVRPLPPDDPADNPEQRANRIRSFYKEYFDDSRPAPAGADYYEDYDEYYLGDGGAIYDEETGQYFTAEVERPIQAEHYARGAMTPPPNGWRAGGPRPRRRHAATVSAGAHSTQSSNGPRTYSSVSGRFGPPAHGHGPPKKRQPPPSALRILPTPHMLKEDAFALPIDFAPPRSARDRQAGRPESPRGGLRPYSPGVRAHTPLARSYDDLAVMPSPHSLRKSGTFTALDFAPPPRFRNAGESASDAGSIRSDRSGMSTRSQTAIRNGAYRVSRIPQEIVGTKGALMDSLKPQWNMHNNTGTIGMPA